MIKVSSDKAVRVRRGQVLLAQHENAWQHPGVSESTKLVAVVRLRPRRVDRAKLGAAHSFRPIKALLAPGRAPSRRMPVQSCRDNYEVRACRVVDM